MTPRRIARDDMDNYFQYDLELGSRTIYLGSCVLPTGEESGTNWHMAEVAIKGLHVLDRTFGPITVQFSTPGGDTYYGLAIYDAIQACSNEVTIVGHGLVMSIGALILQAADRRVLTPHATMMLHYGYATFDGHALEMERWTAEYRRLHTVYEDILLHRMWNKHPNFTRQDFAQLCAFYKYLAADEAVEMGLADAIL